MCPHHPYGRRMINPTIAEQLARDRQFELHRAAEHDRLIRRVRGEARASRHHVPFRSRAGWWLVHAGIRLALTDEPRPVPAR